MNIKPNAYENFFNNGNNRQINFVRKGNTAIQYDVQNNSEIIGVFKRDGNTWTSVNSKRSFTTIDENGKIASGIADGGKINGGQDGYFRIGGYAINA